jgi:hypothetical protein
MHACMHDDDDDDIYSFFFGMNRQCKDIRDQFRTRCGEQKLEDWLCAHFFVSSSMFSKSSDVWHDFTHVGSSYHR